MFIFFIIVIIAGLAAFAFLFLNAAQAHTPLRLELPAVLPLLPADKLPDPSLDELVQIVEIKAEKEALLVKIRKLEQMIEEKNRTITELNKGAVSGQEHDNEVEDLKRILWAQIEELKQRNKQLKEEVDRVLQENVDLQTRVFASSSPAPAAVVVKAVEGPAGQSVPVESAAEIRDALFLHDVFGDDEKGKTV